MHVGIANLHRVMTFWPLVTAHLIEVASQTNADLRDAALDVARLVVAALSAPATRQSRIALDSSRLALAAAHVVM